MPKQEFDFTKIVKDAVATAGATHKDFEDRAYTASFNALDAMWPIIIAMYGNSGLNMNRIFGLSGAEASECFIQMAALAIAFNSTDAEGYEFNCQRFAEVADGIYNYRCMMESTGQVSNPDNDFGLDFYKFVGKVSIEMQADIIRAAMMATSPAKLIESINERRKNWDERFDPGRIARMMMEDDE